MFSRDYKVIGGVLLIFGIYAGVLLWNIWPIQEISVAKSGVFGDSFGALTALFSGLAFAGLLITIFYQREDLDLTKKELRLTREEIKAQHFENMLFRMLEVHNNIISDMDLRWKRTENGHKEGEILATGRDCFPLFHERLKKIYDHKIKKGNSTNILEETYELFWRFSKKDLGHYFRYLYNIFKFINNSNINNKKIYSNIVRAQLSDYELAILFYNGVSKYGLDRFKPLIEELNLLNNIPTEFLLDASHTNLYTQKAFE